MRCSRADATPMPPGGTGTRPLPSAPPASRRAPDATASRRTPPRSGARLDPENPRARRMHALMLVRTGRAEEAAAALRSIAIAGRGDGTGRAGHDAVVEILRRDPDRGRRVRIMEAVADAEPESRYAFARVLAGSDEAERALKLLEVLRRERPADDRYAITHALLLHGQGDRDAALDVLAGHPAENGGSGELLRAPRAAPRLRGTPGGGPRPVRGGARALPGRPRCAVGARPAPDDDGASRRRPHPLPRALPLAGMARRGVVLHRSHRRIAGGASTGLFGPIARCARVSTT